MSGPLEGHADRVISVAFMPDESRVVSSSDDLTVRIWDVETGKTISVSDRNAVLYWCVAFSPDGKCVISGEWGNTLKVWDIEAGSLILDPMQTDHQQVTFFSFSPDNKLLVSRNTYNRIFVWNAITWTPFITVFETGFARGDAGINSTVACSPDGKCIVSLSQAPAVILFGFGKSSPATSFRSPLGALAMLHARCSPWMASTLYQAQWTIP